MLLSEQFPRAAIANHITAEDRDLLLRRHEGRLSYTSGRGRQAVVVSYTVSDDHIVMRVPEYNEIAWYAPGTEVTFTVDGDQTHPRSVQLRRIAVTSECHQQASELDPRAEHWPDGIHVTVICLPLARSGAFGRHFDLMDFVRAIEASDAESQIAAYADSAEVEVVGPENQPSSPHMLIGTIADWVRRKLPKPRSAARDQDHRWRWGDRLHRRAGATRRQSRDRYRYR